MPEKREEHEEAQNAMGDKLKLHIDIDPGEDIEQYSVTWYDLCGYPSVTLKCKTEHEVRQLFKALQAVSEYDVS